MSAPMRYFGPGFYIIHMYWTDYCVCVKSAYPIGTIFPHRSSGLGGHSVVTTIA